MPRCGRNRPFLVIGRIAVESCRGEREMLRGDAKSIHNGVQEPLVSTSAHGRDEVVAASVG